MGSKASPAASHVYNLKLHLQGFRQRTRLETRLLLSTAVTVTLVFVALIIKALYDNNMIATVLHCASVFGLLTFARSVYERNIACEFDCTKLEIQLDLGDIRAFQKSLANVSCNKLSTFSFTSTEKGEQHNDDHSS
jgi:hypothetical protein